jgi:hypothetical protein
MTQTASFFFVIMSVHTDGISAAYVGVSSIATATRINPVKHNLRIVVSLLSATSIRGYLSVIPVAES